MHPPVRAGAKFSEGLPASSEEDNAIKAILVGDVLTENSSVL